MEAMFGSREATGLGEAFGEPGEYSISRRFLVDAVEYRCSLVFQMGRPAVKLDLACGDGEQQERAGAPVGSMSAVPSVSAR